MSNKEGILIINLVRNFFFFFHEICINIHFLFVLESKQLGLARYT